MDRRTTESMTRAGLNLIQQALTIYDQGLRLVLSNRPFQEMFDLPDHLTTVGASFADTIRHLAHLGEYGPLDDIDEFVRERVQVARDFEPHYMERTRANGQVISVEGAPLPQGGWVTVYTDITQIKRQEDMLRARSQELSGQLNAYSQELGSTNRQLASTIAALEQAKQELTEIEARTRLTTEMMPAHIAHVGLDRRYTYSNRRLNSIMPERPSEILGRHIAEALGAQAYAQIENNLNQALGGQESVFEFNDALSSRRIRVAFTPDKSGPRNAINGVYILSMDVTEETQARSTLQQQSKREMAAHLTSGLAHDFSNLLTIILGAQSRLMKMDLPDDARQLIKATHDAANRGGVMLNTIADMTGTRVPSPRSTHIGSLLSSFATMGRSALPVGIELRVHDHSDDREWLLDQGSVQDALLNLVINARDACGDTGRITLAAKIVKDTWIEFTVSDTGPGFSQKSLDHALDPFFTTKGEKGTGLGLTMVYDVAKMSGGELILRNAYGGARVTLRLPARLAVMEHAPGLALMVEDRADLRDTIRPMLTSLGYSVVEARSAAEARALIEGLPEITLVLSDLQLEGDETGVDFISALGESKPSVIFMSSLRKNHPLVLAAQQIAPVLSKPFDANDVRQIMQNGG
jgi:signal transduction histidine kinase/CheY-like chemotaxis protein